MSAMAVTEPRKLSASILEAVGRGRRLDLAFGEVAGSLLPRDRRWVQEATYGTLRNRNRLDFLLDLHLKKGLRSLSPPTLNLLRLGAYQLVFMDGVPPYAAISQTVDQVRKAAGGGAGRMANGVLRSLEREGGGAERFPLFEDDPLAHLTHWGSHPEWLVRRWLNRWRPDQVQALVKQNNTPPDLFLRPFGVSLEDGALRLRDAGFDARILDRGVPCLQVVGGTNPARLLDNFPGIVQDPGAALVTDFADPPEGVRVFDLCAAPGGKALALAGTGVYVLATDRSRSRMRLLAQSRDRLGAELRLVVADATKPPFLEARFVLVDAPCSGTGTLRRHPDARWRLSERMVEKLVGLQGEILQAAAEMIPPHGHLVYSTCTLEEEENEFQVDRFLDRNPDFQPAQTGAVDPVFLNERGFLTVLPQDAGFDGAFAARLVRRP